MVITAGCKVQHKTRNNIRGIVLEISDGQAYLELNNGVECDFPVDQLSSLEDVAAAKTQRQKNQLAVSDAQVPRFPEIWEKLIECDFVKVITNLYSRIPFTMQSYAELSNYQKMNIIEILLGVNYTDILFVMDNKPSEFSLILKLCLVNPTVLGLVTK